MPDFERDARIEDVFSDVSDAVAEYINPRGVDMVYATVRRRRRNQALATGALVLALLAVPGAFALAQERDANPPVGGDPTASSAPPPSATPATPSPSAERSTDPPVPNGRITLGQLRNATFELPPWPQQAYTANCPAGRVTFRNGKLDVPQAHLFIGGQPVYADVDRDGAQETAVHITCSTQGVDSKVVVLDRTAKGKIYTVGQVLGTLGGAGDPGVDLLKVWAIRSEPGGQVGVDVGDYRPCCGTPQDLPQHQWRTYGWNGKRFIQTGGPTAFRVNPKMTDLKASVGNLVMARQPDNTWRGTVTVTVKNNGPHAVGVTWWVEPRFDGLTVTGEGCRMAAGNGPLERFMSVQCEIGRMTVGQSRTATLTFTSVARPAGDIEIAVRNIGRYPDVNNEDNEVRLTVRTS